MALFQSANHPAVRFLKGLQHALPIPQRSQLPVKHGANAAAQALPASPSMESIAAHPSLSFPLLPVAPEPCFSQGSGFTGEADHLVAAPVLRLVRRFTESPAGGAMGQAAISVEQRSSDRSLRSRNMDASAQRQQHADTSPRLSAGAWTPVVPPRSSAGVRMRCRPESLERHGGLVLAGRLEDVCAELDRLVALQELH